MGAQDGDDALLSQLKEVLLRSSDPQFKVDASIAIGSVDTATSADASLKIATSSGIKSPESMRILFSLSERPGARDATTKFVEDNFAQVIELFPGYARPYILSLFGGYCDPNDAVRIGGFFEPRLKVMGGGELELAKTEEQIGICAALKSARGAEIAAAFAH